MKKTLLITSLSLFLGSAAMSQGNPIGTAYISPVSSDNKTVILFEEPVMEPMTIVVKDLTGKTVLSFEPHIPGEECREILISMEEFKRGIYICQITGESGKVKTLKFQKT